MRKSFKIILFSILGILLLLLAAIIIVNTLLKNKFENFLLTRLPSHITQEHKNISLNTLDGTITVSDFSVLISNKENSLVHTKVTVDKLIVENVSYWDYLVNSKIHIEDIKIKSPSIFYYTHKQIKNEDSTSSSGPVKLYKPLFVDALSINNAMLHIYDEEKDSLVLYVENSTINISDIMMDKDIINRRLPVEFKKYKASADSIFVKTNAYENLTVSDFNLEDDRAVFNTIKLKTKYSRTELSQIILTERDHFDLEVKKFTIDDIKFWL